jgi:hypothetical protein
VVSYGKFWEKPCQQICELIERITGQQTLLNLFPKSADSGVELGQAVFSLQVVA